MKLLLILAGVLTIAQGRLLQASVDTSYPLIQRLRSKDIVSAWGIYNDDSTSKFNLNIMGEGDVFLLHIDFRPYLKNSAGIGPIVLNNRINGQWISEIRPEFDYGKFKKGQLFKVSARLRRKEYVILFNDEEVGRFPHRIDISKATRAVLYGGSNGFKWVAIDLPDRSGLPLLKSSSLGSIVLKPGSLISARGLYAAQSAKFSVNLRMAVGGDFMIHVDFRPPPHEGKVVLNSMLNGGWQTEIRTDLPSFNNGDVFQVDIYCGFDRFYIYHNFLQLKATFPYRPSFKLGDVKVVDLIGGSNGFYWSEDRVVVA